MNKAELVEEIVGKLDISKAQAADTLDIFMDTVIKTLRKGERVTLVGFGTFSVSERNEREGRNPQTGEVIQIKAKKVVKFKPGTEFANKIDTPKK